MAQNWSAYCNADAYGQDGGYEDSREEVKFKSGRTIFYNKNSRPKKTHALNFRFDDSRKTNGRTEFEHFLDWYENTIKSGTIPFYLTDIITGNGSKLYRLKETPSWSGQKYKEITLTLEEV